MNTNLLNNLTWKHVGLAVEAILQSGAWQARKYVSPNEVIKVTRVRYGKKFDKRHRSASFHLTVGQPGYREREFIAACKKAGEPFPVKKVQLKTLPIPRK